MYNIETIGEDWITEQLLNLTDSIDRITPSQFNENTRYLPSSVSNRPGYISYKTNPFMKEIINCFDVNNNIREVNLKKGVQVTFTTLIESMVLYAAGHVKTLPMMYISLDNELSRLRKENNILPMLHQSDMYHIVSSSDEGNTKKTGNTATQLQFIGGSYILFIGAQVASKLRASSIAFMFKDEIDAWPKEVGNDGDPDKLSDDRCSGYWEDRKIFRGSTPLIKGHSRIEEHFLNGDQRQYMVFCKSCNFEQFLRWSTLDKDTGLVGGMKWEQEQGTLILESVCYCCSNCGHKHFEYDKPDLFSESNGAYWKPFSKSVYPGVRSYHLPALYSPIDMQPWHKLVYDYLQAYNVKENRVRSITKLKTFYNNVLAEPFEIVGSKIRFVSVSGHRRAVYRMGEIPNEYALEYSGSIILFLTCQVDVHKDKLFVCVDGWTRGSRCYVIDYFKYEVEKDDYDCTELSSKVWGKLRDFINNKVYESDDGKKYHITFTLIDSAFSNNTVITFCNDFDNASVFPLLGKASPSKKQKILEFSKFKTRVGTEGWTITVDYYKDRLAPVMRRDWHEQNGVQDTYHFNCPIDISDKQLEELTTESRKEKKINSNDSIWYWHRPGNAPNELWDLSIYGYCAVEIMAYKICIEHFELENIVWSDFWDYIEESKAYYS